MKKSKSESPQSTKRSFGIFPRAVLLCLTSVILALSLFAITIVKREQNVLLENLKGKAELLAASVDRVTAQAIVAEDYDTVVQQYTKMVESRPEILYAAVTNQRDGSSNVFPKDESGKAVWRLETLEADFWQPEDRNARSEIVESQLSKGERVLHYWYPFSYSGFDWGWIHVGMSLDQYHSNKRDIYMIILLLAAPGLFIGVVLSFAFARRITHPISNLQIFAQQVAAGDLNKRVEIHSRDELGDLANSMNQMTEEIEASIQREAELREKEVLLKEIHHRVKNNMQILSSLLRLQGRKVSTEAMKEMIRESESRIRSMGLIHERLYQTESLSDIDLSGYVQALGKELQKMYRCYAPKTEIEYQIKGVRLALDSALPCGLIINELISNSFKYGFPDGREGKITVAMTAADEGNFTLTVSDNGVGRSEVETEPREGSIGTRLVSMLVEQLNGTIDVQSESNQGFRTHINFSEIHYTQRI